MKKKGIFALVITLIMMMSVIGAGCGSKAPETIEDYMKSDQEAMDQVEETANASGLDVSVSGNVITYTYDLTTIEDVDEETLRSDIMKEQLGTALDASADNFVGLCKQLEEESKIEGVQMVINYTIGDEVIVTRTFDASGPVE